MIWLWFLAILFVPSVAFAHCDIPCGIYSPEAALLAARTVATLVKKILDLKKPAAGSNPAEMDAYENTVSRMVATKEEHAQLCKKELLILWSDYFKPEHLAVFPKLHETFWKAAKLCSRNKQNVDLPAAEELQASVNEIAAVFGKAEEAKKAAAAAASAK
jgi:nickel superoxide dismutase